MAQPLLVPDLRAMLFLVVRMRIMAGEHRPRRSNKKNVTHTQEGQAHHRKTGRQIFVRAEISVSCANDSNVQSTTIVPRRKLKIGHSSADARPKFLVVDLHNLQMSRSSTKCRNDPNQPKTYALCLVYGPRNHERHASSARLAKNERRWPFFAAFCESLTHSLTH